MKLEVADVIWTPEVDYNTDAPNRGAVRVERHSSGWRRTPGDRWMPAAHAFNYGHSTKGNPTKQLLSLFLLFNTLVIRDGIDAQAAHEAFLAIDEYRQTISPDAPGAEAA
jgi:hypothetical protein